MQLSCYHGGSTTNTTKRKKLAWFSHVTTRVTLSMMILQKYMEGKQRRSKENKNLDGEQEGMDRLSYEGSAKHCMSSPIACPHHCCVRC